MNKKIVYYIAILFVIVFFANLIATTGVNFWSYFKFKETEERYNKNSISNEEWLAERQYNMYIEPKVDSLLETNPKLAIKYINKAIKKYPNKDMLYLYRGVGFYKIDSFELALSSFKKSMEINGREFPRAQANVAWALVNLERYDEAIIELRKASETNSNYIYDLADVYEIMGDLKNAIQCYEQNLNRIKTIKFSSYTYKDEIELLEKKIQELNKKHILQQS